MSSFDVTIRNEIDYAINLKNTINDFINKNVKLKRYFNLKEKKLIEFINSLCYFTKFYYKYKGQRRKEIWPSEIEKKTFPITCSNTIIILFPFEQVSIIFPVTFLKDFTYLNQFSNILFEEETNSLQKNILSIKYYNEINKKIMDGCKIIIATVEIDSIIYIDETITDISGCKMEPLKLTDFFNKYL
tara:strand:- start:418 stop:978 length:561 start_codon:yes stop_codon:yes gene_type:complete